MAAALAAAAATTTATTTAALAAGAKLGAAAPTAARRAAAHFTTAAHFAAAALALRFAARRGSRRGTRLLLGARLVLGPRLGEARRRRHGVLRARLRLARVGARQGNAVHDRPALRFRHAAVLARFEAARSEERRVGKECLDVCRSRWSPYH